MVLTGCSASGTQLELAPTADRRAAVGTTSDINQQDPATLQDGGNLRLSLTDFPPNFNILHIDGNNAEVAAMMKATLPRAFIIGPDGSTTVDTNYFTSIELTRTAPQVVTYTINPEAVWSDGTPITWRDIASQIHAISGADKAFEIASSSGAERVASVTRGVDDRQAVVTFAKPYAEWRGMFAGNGMLLPASMTATPEAFNKGQLDGPGPSAGPFVVSALDRTAQRIVLTRNPRWWGARPRLDSITYLVLDDAARLPALQNNTIDATGVGTLDQLTIAARTKGISIRRAPGPSWYHFTLNGAPGSILADKALRLAIAKGIDRYTIARVAQYGLTSDPVPLNNHVFVAGQDGYQDNSGVVAYNPEQAKRELDALLEAKRRVPGEGRSPARHPRSVLRRTKHPAVRPDRPTHPGADRRQTRTSGQVRQRFLQRLRQRGGFRHRTVRLGGRRVSAVIAHPDLRFGRGKQLRQDR